MGLEDFLKGTLDFLGQVADGTMRLKSIADSKPTEAVKKLAGYWIEMPKDKFRSFMDGLKNQASVDAHVSAVLRRFLEARRRAGELMDTAKESENRALRKMANIMESSSSDEFKDLISVLDAVAEAGWPESETAATFAQKGYEWSRR
jgi:hypothetical protein